MKKSTTIPQNKWKWFGESGHLCVGRWCRFHLCTVVGKRLISTVGKFVHPRHSAGSESRDAEFLALHPNGEAIGGYGFYETMVFELKGYCQSKDCNCGMPLTGDDLDCRRYDTSQAATKGHMQHCLRWSKKEAT